MSYKLALKKLQALPESERELASGVYVFSWDKKNGKPHCGCAIGKILSLRIRSKIWEEFDSNKTYMTSLNEKGVGDLFKKFFRGKTEICGMGLGELVFLQQENDSTHGSSNDKRSRHRRYAKIIKMLKEEISIEKEERKHERAVG